VNHLVIVNPRAGRQRGSLIAVDVAEAFQRRDLSFEILTTERPGHAPELIRKHGPRFDAVVVVGGDGTLHEALQDLDLERHRLGVIPLGTGNDFAWMHGWPADLDGCVDRIAAGDERRIDIGVWRGSAAAGPREARFHNSIGLGFEALVNRESARLKGRWGAFTYVLAVIRSLPRYRSFPVDAAWDGGRFSGPATLLDVCAGKRVGGCFLLAPDADAADGRLDLVVADGMGLMRALMLLPRLFNGTHVTSPAVHRHRVTAVRMTFPEGCPLYVDGEFVDDAVRELEVQIAAEGLQTF
jgi:YegS/Rv2252/BmrU family lipid kinase